MTLHTMYIMQTILRGISRMILVSVGSGEMDACSYLKNLFVLWLWLILYTADYKW